MTSVSSVFLPHLRIKEETEWINIGDSQNLVVFLVSDCNGVPLMLHLLLSLISNLCHFHNIGKAFNSQNNFMKQGGNRGIDINVFLINI